MRIRDEHLYHGCALNQIAEHHQFTAINALVVGGNTSRSAFKVNNDIAVYLKYATTPHGQHHEYMFTFNSSNLSELVAIDAVGDNLHLALVCVEDREICCLPYANLVALIGRRRQQSQQNENQYTILVTLEPHQSFRVNINARGSRNTYIGNPIVVPRRNFPDVLFRS